MKLKIAMVLLSTIATLGALAANEKDSDKMITLTGCVQKGDNAEKFKLVAHEGSEWELEGDDVDLAKHVGHTVTLTGKVEHAKSSDQELERGVTTAADAKKKGALEVRNLDMISNTCK